jgi:6-pyruvoyltetrahydropterin/6-carboxytetrahydropterin synthase
MYTIGKQFHFSASHQLGGLPNGHPCGRLHGHNYTVEVILASDTLSGPGFVRDYGDLSVIKQYLDDMLDHQHLNDLMTVEPTAENIAKHIFDFAAFPFMEVVAVRVSETPSTWAEYRLS